MGPHPTLRPTRLTQIMEKLMKAIKIAANPEFLSAADLGGMSPVCGSIFES